MEIWTLTEQPFNVPPFPIAYEFLVQAIRNLAGQLLAYLRMLWGLHISVNCSLRICILVVLIDGV